VSSRSGSIVATCVTGGFASPSLHVLQTRSSAAARNSQPVVTGIEIWPIVAPVRPSASIASTEAGRSRSLAYHTESPRR
jgi:hypothetical protein